MDPHTLFPIQTLRIIILLFTIHFPCYKNHPSTHFSFIPIATMETTYNTTTFHHHHHHQQQQLPTSQDPTTTNITKEHMFEKPLTPSDVGKLNRLVIPKQHAERYFPLGASDTVAQRKGLVLNFEDESGKLWRFRYSYWNSSQSYVLTKGWSRYVKEKRLDAGDVVLFQRHSLDCDRMFIAWRRRFAAVSGQDTAVTDAVAPPVGSGANVNEMVYGDQSSYPSHHLLYQQECIHADVEEMYENVDTYQRGEVATRRLRLFGVNLECQDNPEPSDPYGSSHSGQSDHRYNSGSDNLHHQMMRYHQHEG